jgi:hypothetical protein
MRQLRGGHDGIDGPARRQIVAAVRDGEGLRDLERVIATLPLDREARAALWLSAWCSVEACRPISSTRRWRW